MLNRWNKIIKLNISAGCWKSLFLLFENLNTKKMFFFYLNIYGDVTEDMSIGRNILFQYINRNMIPKI